MTEELPTREPQVSPGTFTFHIGDVAMLPQSDAIDESYSELMEANRERRSVAERMGLCRRVY
jgi:hypothetical protein